MQEENPINKKFRKELASGIASLVVLNLLGQLKEPAYGYRIAKLLSENQADPPLLKQGALYPVLRALEKNGLLASQVEPSVSGPPRRYYSITGSGRDYLAEWNAIWGQTKQLVDQTIQGIEE